MSLTPEILKYIVSAYNQLYDLIGDVTCLYLDAKRVNTIKIYDKGFLREIETWVDGTLTVREWFMGNAKMSTWCRTGYRNYIRYKI